MSPLTKEFYHPTRVLIKNFLKLAKPGGPLVVRGISPDQLSIQQSDGKPHRLLEMRADQKASAGRHGNPGRSLS